MSEPVKVSENVRPQSSGPNSRVRMGEYVLAVIRTETSNTASSNNLGG